MKEIIANIHKSMPLIEFCPLLDRQRHKGIERDKDKGRPRLFAFHWSIEEFVGASLQLCNV
jgi:hypothetical protein